jgi:hypothetical protein
VGSPDLRRSWHHRGVTPTTPTTPATPATTPTPLGEALTHPCARCGAPVPIDVGLCERCNPLGLRDVSASQVHGIAIAGVLVAITLLAVVARLAVTGVGPFEATIMSVLPSGAGLEVMIAVTNEGSATGQTTCRLSDPRDTGGIHPVFLLSPRIEPGETVTYGGMVDGLGSKPIPLLVDCPAP